MDYRKPRSCDRVVMCPKCKGRCRAGSTPKIIAYYYCIAGCEGGIKIPRLVVKEQSCSASNFV